MSFQQFCSLKPVAAYLWETLMSFPQMMSKKQKLLCSISLLIEILSFYALKNKNKTEIKDNLQYSMYLIGLFST